MFIKVKELNKYTSGSEEDYETIINTDSIGYFRYDNDHGSICFKSGNVIYINLESSNKLEKIIYGKEV